MITRVRTARRHRLVAAVLASVLALASALLRQLGLVGRAVAPATSDSTLTINNDQIDTLNPFLSYRRRGPGGDRQHLSLARHRRHARARRTPTSPTRGHVSADKLTWTFKIHPGLKWSDGQPITAKDAAWTFNMIMTNKVAATANGSLRGELREGHRATDDSHARHHDQEAAGEHALRRSRTGIQILPQHVWQSKVSSSLGDFKNTALPSSVTGPWTLTSYQTDQFTELEREQELLPRRAEVRQARPAVLQQQRRRSAGRQERRDRPGRHSVTATQYQAAQEQPGINGYQLAGTAGRPWRSTPAPGPTTGKPLKTNTGNPILADQRRARGDRLRHRPRRRWSRRSCRGSAQPAPATCRRPSRSGPGSRRPRSRSTTTRQRRTSCWTQAGYKKGSDGIRTDPKTGKPLSFRLGTHSDDSYDAQIANYLIGWMKSDRHQAHDQADEQHRAQRQPGQGRLGHADGRLGTGPDPTYLLSIQTCAVLPQATARAATPMRSSATRTTTSSTRSSRPVRPGARAATIKQMQQILYQANDDIVLYYQNDLAAGAHGQDERAWCRARRTRGHYAAAEHLVMAAAAPAKGALGGARAVPRARSTRGLIVGIVVAVVVVAGAAVCPAAASHLRRRRSRSAAW